MRAHVTSSLLMLFVAGPAWADPPAEATVYAKRTLVDFSALSITGETSRPEASYVVVPKRARFRTLIRTRGDFLPEIERSVGELR